MPGGSFCGVSSSGSIPVGPVLTTLKSGLNDDLTEKILSITMCRFCIESVEHPRGNNNVAAHTTPQSVFAIDIGAIYPICSVQNRWGGRGLPARRSCWKALGV